MKVFGVLTFLDIERQIFRGDRFELTELLTSHRVYVLAATQVGLLGGEAIAMYRRSSGPADRRDEA